MSRQTPPGRPTFHITLDTNQTNGVTAKSRLGPNGKPNTYDDESTEKVIDTYTREPDGKRKHPYVGRKPRTTSFSKEVQSDNNKCEGEGSYCTISGGKRRKSRKQRGNRKSRKQRGSRKSKKSRRR